MLSFISDEDLKKYTVEVLDKTDQAYQQAEIMLHSNILDPISALFDTVRQNISVADWLKQEKSRQVQKTLQNAVGDFHQKILGSVIGWENPGRGGGYDLINKERKIIVELKNKHNTLNSGSAESTFRKMKKYISTTHKGYTAYVVFIVPKNPEDFDVPWIPGNKNLKTRKDIRKIDGESFYALVTGEKDALENLFTKLPDIICEILKNSPIDNHERTLFKELFHTAYK